MFWAFVTLMLYKLGGTECISQEQMEKFNADHGPEVLYDHDKKVWIMKIKEGQESPVIVTVPKKVLRKPPRIFRS